MEYLGSELVRSLLVMHFTFVFFMAIATVGILWRQDMRERALEYDERPHELRPIVENRVILFLCMLIGGFSALIWAFSDDIKLLIKNWGGK